MRPCPQCGSKHLAVSYPVRRSHPPAPSHSTGRQQVLMETTTGWHGEVNCDLYMPLTQGTDLAATIAAIP